MRRTDDSHFAVPEELQRVWARRLLQFYELYNDQYLKGQLRPPAFRIDVSESQLGSWDSLSRTITMSARHIIEHRWESVLDTLRHEMAHQYVHDVLGMGDAEPHGSAFQRACRLLRCDAGATARGATLEKADRKRREMVERVKELLALAGSPNEHEAANAMRMANKYLLKYNLSLSEMDGPKEYSVRHLGKCSARVQEYEYSLAHILQEHFFVQVIWTFSYDPLTNKSGRVLQISGTDENLEIAEYVHDYVMRLTKPLWEAHRAQWGSQNGTKFQYLAGVIQGLSDKLDAQRTTLKSEHGLVWRDDPELQEFFRHLHPRTRTIGGSGVRRGGGYEAGRRDGKEINIHKGVSSRGRNRGRLLE